MKSTRKGGTRSQRWQVVTGEPGRKKLKQLYQRKEMLS